MRPPRRLSIRRFDCGSKAGAMQPGSECKDGSRVPPIAGKVTHSGTIGAGFRGGRQPGSGAVGRFLDPTDQRPNQ